MELNEQKNKYKLILVEAEELKAKVSHLTNEIKEINIKSKRK